MTVVYRDIQRKKAGATDPWSEHRIAAALARQTFQRRCLVIVPNCNWTGHECDLLVVEKRLRIIDVEIKISRADLKADAKKEKWWHRKFVGCGPRREIRDQSGRLVSADSKAIYNSTPREWPPRVWKHYYALPRDIWDDSLLECLPSPASGVIALWEGQYGGIGADVVRRAKPCKDASKLTGEQAVDVARLANLRLWDAYDARDRMLDELQQCRQEAL